MSIVKQAISHYILLISLQFAFAVGENFLLHKLQTGKKEATQRRVELHYESILGCHLLSTILYRL